MANRKFIVNGKVYEASDARKVVVSGKILEEDSAAAVGGATKKLATLQNLDRGFGQLAASRLGGKLQ
jgi:hypothetical protein